MLVSVSKKPKIISSNVLVCPQPKDIQFAVLKELRNQKIFSNFWHFVFLWKSMLTVSCHNSSVWRKYFPFLKGLTLCSTLCISKFTPARNFSTQWKIRKWFVVLTTICVFPSTTECVKKRTPALSAYCFCCCHGVCYTQNEETDFGAVWCNLTPERV